MTEILSTHKLYNQLMENLHDRSDRELCTVTFIGQILCSGGNLAMSIASNKVGLGLGLMGFAGIVGGHKKSC